MKNILKTLLGITIPIIILLLPLESFPIENLTLVEQRVMAIFAMAALFWVLEPIPIYATSILVIFSLLVMVSDKGFIGFRQADPAQLGTLLDHRDIFATFASPIILLFMGGFFLAMAATKYRLDVNAARVMLKPFGSKPSIVMLGLMVITAIFSMFMSNTATTAMMLSILGPVLALFDENDKGRIALALSVPFAANVGGIGTPIGTPPNAIALKYLTGDDYISFGEWMVFAVPLVVVLLFIAWVLLSLMYPVSTKSVQLAIKGKFLMTRKAIIVYVTFAATILLWLLDFAHGMNSYVVAMLPVAVFLVTNIITKEDLKKISWDVLWLVAGGIALGVAMDRSGLAQNAVDSIPFASFPPIAIIAAGAFLCLLMANFMSHTATANLLLPIVAVLGTTLPGLEQFGGSQLVVLTVALSASLGMSLPISTPPNALAHATGFIESRDMARVGAPLGIIGVFFTFLLMYVMDLLGFFA